MNKKLIGLIAAVLAIAGIVIGVQPNGSTADHNATDVAFAQDMIPHHEQAVEMADYVGSRSTDPQVRALALAIKGAQSPEITAMTGWLRSWHETVPGKTGVSAGGMDMGGSTTVTGMQGMMSDADMTSLQTLQGSGFDKMWLTMMTTHHTGAIDMAATELSQGHYAPATALAHEITTSQSVQIAQMRQLLQRF